METRRALLLIADIGGYTEYMKEHRSILAHAEAATARMLERVVDAARGFELIEIEGDAAFLSRDAGNLDEDAQIAVVTQAAVAMHRAFHAERRIVELNLCPCVSCAQTRDLKLKFVAHVGEVASQTIRKRTKLVGMDVIYVHRLLKNGVPVPEYVLLSEDLYGSGNGVGAPDRPARQLTEELEGIGTVLTYFVDVDDLPGANEPIPDPGWPKRFRETLRMAGRGPRFMARPVRVRA